MPADPTDAHPPTFAALRMLLPFLRPYRGRAAGAVIALLVAAALVLLLGQGVRLLIDQGFAGRNMAQLNQTERERPKPEMVAPRQIIMVRAMRPLLRTLPNPATASAPTTEPAPDMERNSANVPESL